MLTEALHDPKCFVHPPPSHPGVLVVLLQDGLERSRGRVRHREGEGGRDWTSPPPWPLEPQVCEAELGISVNDGRTRSWRCYL